MSEELSDITSESNSSSSDSDNEKGRKDKLRLEKNDSDKKHNQNSKKARIEFMKMLETQFGINEKVLIKFDELEFGNKIGQGSYGEVFKGKWLG